MLDIKISHAIWYEDGEVLECWENDDIHEERHMTKCSLQEAIEFAYTHHLFLELQPMYQDQVIEVVDYTENKKEDLE